MVLVDPWHPDMWTRLPPEVVATLKPPTLAGERHTPSSAPRARRLIRHTVTGGDLAKCGLPAQQCKEAQAYFRSTRYRMTQGQGVLAPDRDAQVRATSGLGDRPLMVLSAGDY